MMHASLALVGALVGGPEITWEAPERYVEGGPYKVRLEVSAPEGGATLVGWLLTPAAFTVNGEPLAEREDRGTLQMPQGAVLNLDVDLGPLLEHDEGTFELAYAKEYLRSEPIVVSVLRTAPHGIDFMTIPVEELSKYNVLLETNRGDMLLGFWPDVAPNHVRNFLDLSAGGFYAGTLFHRVGTNFMIQGGDPNTRDGHPQTWGGGGGPRRVKLEKSDRKHVKGVLSAARTNDPNSHSSQFFVMHGPNTGLDGQYSAFGKLVSGYDTLDRIATCAAGPRLDQATYRPRDPQKIVKAVVVFAEE